MKMYCQFYEVEIDIGCPTRFRLPEPSNMRHAAQVRNSHLKFSSFAINYCNVVYFFLSFLSFFYELFPQAVDVLTIIDNKYIFVVPVIKKKSVNLYASESIINNQTSKIKYRL